MSGTIIIENLTGRHLQYRIEHQLVCVKVGKCFCKQGRRGTVASSVHVPGGVGSKTAPLHPAVATLPQIQVDARGPRPKIKIHGSKTTEKQAKEAAAEAKAKAKEQEKLQRDAAKQAKDSGKPAKGNKGGGGGRQGNKN